jgi:DNA invertase Pin-like site-specific DNA recombinase
LVANDLARLHRKFWHVGRLLEELDGHGIRLMVAAPGREIDTSTPQGRMFIQFLAMQDEAFAEDIALRQRDSIAYRKSQGKSIGRPPFGTRRNDDGYLTPTEYGVWLLPTGTYQYGKEAEQPEPNAQWFGFYDCLKRIYSLYADNQTGLNRLAYQVTEEGWRFPDHKRRPRPFATHDIRRIVGAWREYAGMPTVGRGRDQNASKLDSPSQTLIDTGRAVLPLELIRAVATVQEERSVTTNRYGKQRRARLYALTGLVYCAHCEEQARQAGNAGLRSRINGATQYGNAWYRHVEGRRCGCKSRSIRLDELEADFARLLSLLTLSDEGLASLTELARKDIPNYSKDDDAAFEREREKNLARLQRKRENQRWLFSQGETTREDYLREIEQVDRETAYWQNRTTDAQRIAVDLRKVVAAMGQISAGFPAASVETKREMAHSLVDHLVYDLDQKRIVDFRLKAWADPYLILRASLDEVGSKEEVNSVLHTSRKSREFTPLERIAAAAAHFLDRLYPPASSPRTTAERNAAIRARFEAGESQAALARAYGISYQRIFQIVRGEA